MVRDRELRRAAVHGVAKSQAWLSDWTTATGVQALGVDVGIANCGAADKPSSGSPTGCVPWGKSLKSLVLTEPQSSSVKWVMLPDLEEEKKENPRTSSQIWISD